MKGRGSCRSGGPTVGKSSPPPRKWNGVFWQSSFRLQSDKVCEQVSASSVGFYFFFLFFFSYKVHCEQNMVRLVSPVLTLAASATRRPDFKDRARLSFGIIWNLDQFPSAQRKGKGGTLQWARKVGTLLSRNPRVGRPSRRLVHVVRLREKKGGPPHASPHSPPAARSLRGDEGPAWQARWSGMEARFLERRCEREMGQALPIRVPGPRAAVKACHRGRDSRHPRKHFRRGASRVKVMAPLQEQSSSL